MRSKLAKYITSMEDSNIRNTEVVNPVEISLLREQVETDEIIQQVVETSVEMEEVESLLTETQNDTEQVGRIKRIVENTLPRGMSPQTAEIATESLNYIYRKYGLNVNLPSLESYSGITGDASYSTESFNKQITISEEGLKETVKNLFKKLIEMISDKFDHLEKLKNKTLKRIKQINELKDSLFEGEDLDFSPYFVSKDGNTIDPNNVFDDTVMFLNDLKKLEAYVKEIETVGGVDDLTKLVGSYFTNVYEEGDDGLHNRLSLLGGVSGNLHHQDDGTMSFFSETLSLKNENSKVNLKQNDVISFFKELENSLNSVPNLNKVNGTAKVLLDKMTKEAEDEKRDISFLTKLLRSMITGPWMNLYTRVLIKINGFINLLIRKSKKDVSTESYDKKK